MKIADSLESMQKAEERALKQIEEMRYADGMYVQGYQKVIKYGAAFYRNVKEGSLNERFFIWRGITVEIGYTQ